LLENELSISDSLPDIEKIISTEGKIKINSADVTADKVTINGDLVYSIIYRSDDENISVCSMSGKIPFNEETHVDGADDNMEATVNSYIDYIDSEQLTEKTFSIKAVAVLDSEIKNKRSIEYISNLESDGSFQAKSRNITYTDLLFHSSEEISVNEAVQIGKNENEISNILKADGDTYITNIDVMNDRMLVEGIFKVGFLYAQEDTSDSVGYISEEFPFTHYIEVKNSSEDTLRDIDIVLSQLTYDVTEDLENEKKMIEFNASLTLNANLYDTIEKNIITDGYSTETEVEIDQAKVKLSSINRITNTLTKYENNFDVASGTIKDIYTVEISPKISEKKVVEDKYIVDGFLDTNLLYLNGDMNKIDRAYASMPFTVSVDLNDGEKFEDLVSNTTINKCSAYRKGNNSIMVNCDINVALKNKQSNEITVISNISEAGPLDYDKSPSLVFRVIQPNEDLWDIAKNYNVSINYLKELNNISLEDTLTPGSKVIIARQV
jgi:hypothetical protein